MTMIYYKHILNNEVVAYVSSPEKCADVTFFEISEEEYNAAIEEMRTHVSAEEVEEQTISERIAELEAENAILQAENAALLYQVLTGEELSNA